ncbi:MAG: hypothetical protein ACM3Q2_08965, partial [Syntrophothermus sp.]
MNKSIKIKMLVTISVSVFLLILLITVVTISIVTTKEKEIAVNSVALRASSLAEDFNNLISRKYELSKTLANCLEANSFGGRSEAMDAFKKVLEKDQEIIDNFLVYEPGAFDGKDNEFRNKPGHDSTGRFNFNYNRYSGPIQLAAGIDVDISDYYTVPKKTLQPLISEPYLYEGV